MSELSAFADFISHYGWLGVTILLMAAWIRGWFHADREFQREVTRGDKALEQRDAAIKLAQELTEIMESGRRGQYRGGR